MTEPNKERSETSKCIHSEVLLATKDCWYMVDDNGVTFVHYLSEKLRDLCRQRGVRPAPGMRLRNEEVFFIKTDRGCDQPFGIISPAILSFDLQNGGSLQTIEFERHSRLYLAGITVREGRAYYWDGYEVFELLGDGKRTFLCKVRNPISNLAVVSHENGMFSFYYNILNGIVFLHSCRTKGSQPSSVSVGCAVACHLVGSHKSRAFGWNYDHRRLYVLDNGEIVQEFCWYINPKEIVSSGPFVYMMFDDLDIHILNTDNMYDRALVNSLQGTLVVREYVDKSLDTSA